jgi:GNAT superfamily N-acetyltransferase
MYKLKVIKSKKDKIEFVKSQKLFYLNNQNFIVPYIKDRLNLIDTEKNPFYNHSEIELYLCYDEDDNIVGRIAAIVNKNHNILHNDKVGFFGFFECIYNQEVANILFNTAEQWLNNKGMEFIRGPVNPSMNDENAFLIENFDDPPYILMPYNHKYYNDLVENYGFYKAKDLYAYKLTTENFATDKMVRLYDNLIKRYKITIRNINLKNNSQFKEDIKLIKEIYNKAWELNWGFVKLTDDEIDFFANDLKLIAEESLAFFVYSDNKIVGFHLALPDYNQVFKYNKSGNTLETIWNLITKKNKINRCRIIILGILPEYRNKGIDAVMYMESGLRAKKLGYIEGEASWILEDNEMMNRGLTTTMNAKLYKKYRIYEKRII